MHAIDGTLLSKRVHIALIGAGGNGSQMLTGLARLDRALRSLGHPGGFEVTTWDPDTVSVANIGRQLFSPADVGLHKAIVLTHRVNCFYGLDWRAIPGRYNADMERAYYGTYHNMNKPDLVISCVDTAASRREIESMIKHAWCCKYWLDLGNRQQDGQVILGETNKGEVPKRGKKSFFPKPLPTVMDIFPELHDESLVEDNHPSCSLAEALESQDLFVNQSVVTWALHLLWTLFRKGEIEHHGYFINLETGVVNPLPVSAGKELK